MNISKHEIATPPSSETGLRRALENISDVFASEGFSTLSAIKRLAEIQNIAREALSPLESESAGSEIQSSDGGVEGHADLASGGKSPSAETIDRRESSGGDSACVERQSADHQQAIGAGIKPGPSDATPARPEVGETDEQLAEQIHTVAGCHVGSERTLRIIKWFRSKSATPQVTNSAEVDGDLTEDLKEAEAHVRRGGWITHANTIARAIEAIAAHPRKPLDLEKVVERLKCAEELLSRIEVLVPNWKSFGDLAEAVEVALHHAGQR